MKKNKRTGFINERLEITYRDNLGRKVYVDKGKPEKVLSNFLGKFSNFEEKIIKLGEKIKLK